MNMKYEWKVTFKKKVSVNEFDYKYRRSIITIIRTKKHIGQG